MGSENIGKKIINYRTSKGMSIRTFSEMTGLSPSMLSQLERGIGNPTLSALKSISQVLGISLSDMFIEETDNKDLILRKDMRKKIFDPNDKHILYDMLTQGYSRTNVEMILLSLKGNSETFGGFSKHEGEEIGYITKGEVDIIFENEVFTLYEGDTVRILPTRKHKFKNNTESDVEILFVKSKML